MLNRPVVLKKKSYKCFFAKYGHAGHPEFQIMTFLAKFCLTIIYLLNMKFHLNWLSSLIGNVIYIFS